MAGVQGFDTDGISGQDQLAAARDGEGVHPVEVADGSASLLCVEVQDHLAVALGGEPMVLLQPSSKRRRVVDLAVGCERLRPVAA